MNTDAFFIIGKTHAICQDYARASRSRIQISDGCSSASNTDFGARFLVVASEYLMDNDPGLLFDHKSFGCSTITSARLYCQAMGLPLDCLCATLLTAQVRNKRFCCLISGDGVL